MAAHYDAAGRGLDRFQPIVTPAGYPGHHYDSTIGIDLSQSDKEGFLDRFWGRGIASRDNPGLSAHRGASLPEAHSSIRSPMCPRCELLQVEMQNGKYDGPHRISAINGVYSSCCCPDIHMPAESTVVGSQFSRRHSSLWEKGHISLGQDTINEERTDEADPLWEAPDGSSVAVSLPLKRTPLGGPRINSLEGYSGREDEDLQIGWSYRTRSGDLLAHRSSVRDEV